MYNLLEDKFIRVRLTDDPLERSLSLPEIYEEMARDTVLSFTALRAHQRHAWHAFLAQLGAMACYDAGLLKPPGPASEWKKIIRSLTTEFPEDEPWHLVVDNVDKPAFLQCPAPDLATYKNTITAPDDIDVLVTSKNHDIKQSIVLDSQPDDWLFALLTRQTMGGFMGRGNYGIARMNGGQSTRPCLALAPMGTGVGGFLFSDISRMLQARSKLLNNFSHYPDKNGHKLLWLLDWQGKESESLPLSDLDIFFIEICRRIRLQTCEHGGGVIARGGNSESTRVQAKEALGNLGDFWTPVVKGDPLKSLTLASKPFGYKRLSKLLFDEGSTILPESMLAGAEEAGNWRLVARGYVAGQGKTEGYFERNDIVFGKKVSSLLGLSKPESQKQLYEVSERMIQEIAEVVKALRSAISIVASGGKELSEIKISTYSYSFVDRLEKHADELFFTALQERFEEELGGDEQSQSQLRFISSLISFAEGLLEKAIHSVPCPRFYKHRAATKATKAFFGMLYRQKSEFGDLAESIKEMLGSKNPQPAPNASNAHGARSLSAH